MGGGLTELSEHRFQWAVDDLETAKHLFQNKRFRQSINRSYYAVFHAIRSVNALDGFDSSKHSGVIAHFNQTYVKPGYISKEASKIVRHSSELREQADYDDFFEANEELAQEAFLQAGQFVNAVKEFLIEQKVLR